MSYNKTTWSDGDVITANGLNHLEGGVEDAQLFVVNITGNDNDGYVADKSAMDIMLAAAGEQQVVATLYNYTIGTDTVGVQLYLAGADSVAVIFRGFTMTDEVLARIRYDAEDNEAMVINYPSSSPLIVELTPTAADYSGTMDREPFEIADYYRNGRKIIFRIPSMGVDIEATQIASNGYMPQALVTYNMTGVGWVQILLQASDSDATYSTIIFPLTPAP